MRVKTEEKRDALLEAAKAVFLERGYGSASMAEVSARAGGSKQTLYSYFASKEDLFVAVMLEKGAEAVFEIFGQVRHSTDLRAGLTRFGLDLLQFLLRDEVLAVRRIIIAEGAKSNLGLLFYENGPKRGWGQMADYFAQMMEQGRMRRANPETAALHLRGLLETGPFILCLEGAQKTVSLDEITRTVDDAVEIFIRAYAPDASETAA